MIADISQGAILTCVIGVSIIATAVVAITRLARNRTSAMDMLLRTSILTLLLLPLVQFICDRTQLGWHVPVLASSDPKATVEPNKLLPHPAEAPVELLIEPPPSEPLAPVVYYQTEAQEKDTASAADEAFDSTDHPANESSSVQAVPIGDTVETKRTNEPINWAGMAALLWVLGVMVLVLRGVPARVILLRICRRARRLDEDQSDRIRGLGIDSLRLDQLRVTNSIHGPAVAGVCRPLILLPANLFDLDDATLKSAILHEQAHIQRRDPLMLWAAGLLKTLWWFHPSVWLLCSSFRRTVETMCDNHAIESAGSISYAETLLRLSERYKSNHSHALSLSMLGKQTRLERRIASLLNSDRDGRIRADWKTKLAIAVPIALLGFASASQLWGQPPEKPQDVETETQETAAKETTSDKVGKTPVVAALNVAPWMIHGTVIDQESGNPVAGAHVFARIGWKGDPDAQTISDADGKFFIQNVKHKRHIVWATTDTMTSGTRYSSEDASFDDAGTLKESISLKLHPGTKVRVRVVDAKSGEPIAGAKVYGAWMQSHLTDADGYAFTNPLSGKSNSHTWTIRARAARYGEAVQDIDIRAAKHDELVTLKMLPGITIEGKITDALNDKPIDGASVMVNIPGRHSFWLDTKSKDGSYRITDVPYTPGVTLSAQCDSGYELFRKPLEFKPKAHLHRQDVQMQRIAKGGSWIANVFSDDGPIEGATVELKSRKDETMITKKTNEKGDVFFGDLYLDDEGYDAWVRANGFADQRELYIAPWDGQGPQKTHMFRMNNGHTLRVRVADENNQPINRVHVRVGRTGFSVRTDANGLVRFDGLEEMDTVSFTADGYSDVLRQRLAMDTQQPVDVVMKPAGFIKLKVVESDGQPISRYVVKGWFTQDSRNDDAPGSISSRFSQVGVPIIDEDGEGLIPDWSLNQAAMLFVTADGYRRGVVSRAVAKAKSEATAVKIVLQKIDPAKTKRVAGRLLRPDGTAAAGARIAVIVGRPNMSPKFSWQGWNRQTHLQAAIERVEHGIVDADGKFQFNNIPPGGSIWLAYDGNVPRQIIRDLETKTAKELANLSLKTSVAAQIQLVRSPEFEGQRFHYTIEDGEGTKVKSESRILPNRSLIAKNLPPGTYDITISVNGQSHDYVISVAKGEHAKIHFPPERFLKQLVEQEKPFIQIRPVEIVKQILSR